MPVSKQDLTVSLFDKKCAEIDMALMARTSPDEVTYISIEGLPTGMAWDIQKLYRDLGWKVEYEECAGEYEDLWFS